MISCVRILLFVCSIVVESKFADVCKLSNGNVGFCIVKRHCPKLENEQKNMTFCNSDERMVCCPAMQRIVTPVNPQYPTQSPLVYTTQRTTLPIFSTASSSSRNPMETPVPLVDGSYGTTTISVINNAVSKCEEYKHSVKKRSSIMTYVFGGTESISREFPHMAALGYGVAQKVDWLCGGSLISEKFVLTAAHCLSTANLGMLVKVRLGDLNLQSDDDDGNIQEFGVSQKIVHPNYQPPQQYNDIGLIKLDRNAILNENVFPICLEIHKDLPNSNFIATGWGKTELGGSTSEVLMKVDLEYFPNDICNRNYAEVAREYLRLGILDDSQLCAGSYSDERDTCQGDSGGPLQIRDDTLYIVGITSFGKVCGEPNSPAVYTRVSYYVPWIEQIVWN